MTIGNNPVYQQKYYHIIVDKSEMNEPPVLLYKVINDKHNVTEAETSSLLSAIHLCRALSTAWEAYLTAVEAGREDNFFGSEFDAHKFNTETLQ